MACNADELAALPLLLGCPAGTEWYLVGNAAGGVGEYRYARRTIGALMACLTSGVVLPYIGVVDRGQAKDPVSGTSTFQNDDLIGLGVNNNGDMQIVLAEILRSNFGDNKSFEFDPVTGTINLDYNGSGEQFFPGSSLYVDRNQ